MNELDFYFVKLLVIPFTSPFFFFFLLSIFQEVRDRVCLRSLEKMMNQLVDSKEQTELLSASALQPVDFNTDGRELRFRPPFIVQVLS